VLAGNQDAFNQWVEQKGTRAHRPAAEHPGGSDTGVSWAYLRYPHLASTAWTGLLLLYQADDWQPVWEDANPLAAPADAVPAGDGDTSCLPPKPPPGRDTPSSSGRRRGEPGRWIPR